MDGNALQFGGDLHVLAVERGKPVAVMHGTSEFLLLPERHVVVGGTGDCGRGLRVPRRVERHVHAAERAGAVRHVPAHARRSRRGRRFRTHRAMAVCGSNTKLCVTIIILYYAVKYDIMIAGMTYYTGNIAWRRSIIILWCRD